MPGADMGAGLVISSVAVSMGVTFLQLAAGASGGLMDNYLAASCFRKTMALAIVKTIA